MSDEIYGEALNEFARSVADAEVGGSTVLAVDLRLAQKILHDRRLEQQSSLRKIFTLERELSSPRSARIDLLANMASRIAVELLRGDTLPDDLVDLSVKCAEKLLRAIEERQT